MLYFIKKAADIKVQQSLTIVITSSNRIPPQIPACFFQVFAIRVLEEKSLKRLLPITLRMKTIIADPLVQKILEAKFFTDAPHYAHTRFP